MAKPKNETPSEVVENATPVTDAPATSEGGAAASTEGKKAGGAAIVLANGMRRIDYIRQEFAKGRSRGEIAKELGVAYQIVFAATKTVKAEAAPAADAAPAAEGDAAAATAADETPAAE